MIKTRKYLSSGTFVAGYFTLVEVTLAIAVIAIGMVGVLALFPVGFQASRDAVGDNYSSQLADQTLHLIALQAKSYHGDGQGQGDDGWGDWITGDSARRATGTETLPSSQPTDLDFSSNDINTAKNNPFLGTDEFGLYQKANGVYYLESKSGGIVDFSAVVAIWQVPATVDIDGDGTPYDIDAKYARRLFLEISWPVRIAYEKREKRVYMLDIFNRVARN